MVHLFWWIWCWILVMSVWIYALHIWWICDCVGEEGLREIFEIKIHCETKFAILVLSRLKKKKLQQTYIIFSNDKLIIRSTISIMWFIAKIFVVQFVSLNVSNKNIQSSNLIFSLLYIWIIKLLRNENIRDVHIGNTTKVWIFFFFFFK